MNFVGIILSIVAVILIYLGADAYGRHHKSYVAWSIISYVLVVVGTVVAAVLLAVQAVIAFEPTQPREAFSSVWTSLTILIGLAVAASAIPYSLITYNLQDERGRRVILGAIGFQVAYGGVTAWYFLTLESVFLELLEGTPGGFSLFLGSPVIEFVLPLGSLVWALVYYLAYRSVTSERVTAAAMT